MDCSFLTKSYLYIILKCLLRDQFKLNMCVDQVGAKKAEKDSKVPEITSNQPSNIVKVNARVSKLLSILNRQSPSDKGQKVSEEIFLGFNFSKKIM